MLATCWDQLSGCYKRPLLLLLVPFGALLSRRWSYTSQPDSPAARRPPSPPPTTKANEGAHSSAGSCVAISQTDGRVSDPGASLRPQRRRRPTEASQVLRRASSTRRARRRWGLFLSVCVLFAACRLVSLSDNGRAGGAWRAGRFPFANTHTQALARLVAATVGRWLPVPERLGVCLGVVAIWFVRFDRGERTSESPSRPRELARVASFLLPLAS